MTRPISLPDPRAPVLPGPGVTYFLSVYSPNLEPKLGAVAQALSLPADGGPATHRPEWLLLHPPCCCSGSGVGSVGSGPPVAASGHDLLTCNPVLSTSRWGEGLALGPMRSLHMHFTFRLLVLACP